MNGTKTVKVSAATHRALTALCRKDETYGELINRILDYYVDTPQGEEEKGK